MIWKIAIGLLTGAGLGALLGSTGSCETGACPLTATPLRGAIYGAFIGLLFGLSMASGARDDSRQESALTAPEQTETIPGEREQGEEPAIGTSQAPSEDSDLPW
jgi:hypothetical protein